MPATTRFAGDGGAHALHEDYAGFNDAGGGFVLLAVTGLKPTDTVQSCALVAKRDRNNTDPSLFSLVAGGATPSADCTLEAAGPSGTVWLAKFWLTAAMTTLLLTTADYDCTLTVLRNGVTLQERIQFGQLTATIDLRDVNVSTMLGAVVGPALLASAQVLAGALYTMGASVETAGSVSATMDPAIPGLAGVGASVPAVRAALSAATGNALTIGLVLMPGAVAASLGFDIPMAASPVGPALAIDVAAAVGNDFAMGVAVKSPTLSLSEEVATGLDAAVTDTGPIEVAVLGGQDVVGTVAVALPPRGVTVAASQSASHFFTDNFTEVATTELHAHNAGWVQVYTGSATLQVVGGAGYVEQSTVAGGSVFYEYQGVGSPTGYQKITVPVYSDSTNHRPALLLRGQGTGAGYIIFFNESAGSITLRKVQGGSVLKTFTATLPASAQTTVVAEMSGSTLTLTVGAQSPETYTDSTYASGKAGIGAYDIATPFGARHYGPFVLDNAP